MTMDQIGCRSSDMPQVTVGGFQTQGATRVNLVKERLIGLQPGGDDGRSFKFFVAWCLRICKANLTRRVIPMEPGKLNRTLPNTLAYRETLGIPNGSLTLFTPVS